MTFRFLAEDFDRYIKKGKPGDGVHNGRHIWDDLLDQLKAKFGVPFSPAAWKTHGDWLELLWLAPYKSPRGTWANQAQFFLSRSIQDKKLHFGLCIEFEPLKGNTSASDRDGWCFLQQLQDEKFARVLDALLTNNDWDATIRDWSDKLHSVAKNSAEIAAALGNLEQDSGWNVYIQKTLDASTAVAAGEEIGQRIMDGFMAVRPLWEAVIPEADREYLYGRKTRLPRLVDPAALFKAQLAQDGLYFTPWQLATFYTALQTKGFVILSGISGTGKTRLAQAFADMLPQPTEGTNHLFVPVRPDWRDSKSLLGYYNPLTGTHEWTPFLRFLLRVVQSYEARDGLAWFVILDEMNLAHVEYYFADLLSVMESGRDEDGWTREPLRLGYPDEAEGNLPPRELKLPPNLYIVGTVNVDETTHAFSPKVLDRAFTLELTDVDFRQYQPTANLAESVVDAVTGDALLRQFSRDGKFARVEKDVIAGYARMKKSKRNYRRSTACFAFMTSTLPTGSLMKSWHSWPQQSPTSSMTIMVAPKPPLTPRC